MLATTKFTGAAFVPSQGWVFFGGHKITMTTAQQLVTLGADWTIGPDLYMSNTTENMCTLQVKKQIFCNTF